jgi:hypothetical protein
MPSGGGARGDDAARSRRNHAAERDLRSCLYVAGMIIAFADLPLPSNVEER